MAALSDDLNTPVALAQLNAVCKKANELRRRMAKNKNQAAELLRIITNFAQVLGLLRYDPCEFIAQTKQAVLTERGVTEKELQELISRRATARKDKNFQLADEIRDNLHAKGIDLQDNPDTTTWSLLD